MNSLKKAILGVLIVLCAAISFNTMAQPNPPGGERGQGGNQNGGNAPIGSGLLILLGLGAAYGGKKAYALFIENKEDLEE